MFWTKRKDDQRPPYATDGVVWMIPTGDIRPNPLQPRREFRYETLLELAQSIQENGLLHPLTVTFRDGVPILVAGERRLRAAKIAGIREVPCLAREADEAQRAVLTLLENLQREDMNCFETARGIRQLIDAYGFTQEEAAQRLGCSQPRIANALRLLRLSDEEQQTMIAAGLSERHARALLRLDTEEKRRPLLEKIIRDKLTVAQTERLVAECLAGKVRRKPPIPVVRDVRVFFNTVNHAVELMQRSGIAARSEQLETDEYIEYVVRIPKAEARSRSRMVHTA